MSTADPSVIATRIREDFSRQRVMAHLGAVLGVVEPGAVEIELPIAAHHTQQNGFVHAGVLATVCDSACGYAALTMMPADKTVLSIEFKIHLLAPASGERLLARGSVVRAGRTITTCLGEVYSITGAERKKVALMTATMIAADGAALPRA